MPYAPQRGISIEEQKCYLANSTNADVITCLKRYQDEQADAMGGFIAICFGVWFLWWAGNKIEDFFTNTDN